jgi:hypothetical protein
MSERGCTCDLEPGQMDECVFDGGETRDCIVAGKLVAEGKGRNDCEYWRPEPAVRCGCGKPGCRGVPEPAEPDELPGDSTASCQDGHPLVWFRAESIDECPVCEAERRGYLRGLREAREIAYRHTICGCERCRDRWIWAGTICAAIDERINQLTGAESPTEDE